MAKKETLENSILKILEATTKSLKISEIADKLDMNITEPAVKRSCQRALKKLSESNLINPSGNARARAYSFTATRKITSTTSEPSSLLKEISLTTEAQKLFKYVSQPLTQRTPVGYNQNFLKSYTPNTSSYLSEKQKKELLNLGRVDPKEKPAGTYARDILSRLLIDLSWNSSRLEGNTYSLLETTRLIELGESADGKNVAEAQMILNHKAAIEFLVESVGEIGFDRLTICNLHALLSDNLLGDPSASGKLRERSVQISGSAYLPIDNPHFLAETFELFLKKAKKIEDPFEQCFFTLVHLSYLQSFEDVNKRTSRIAANIPLIKKNFKPLAFVDVDQNVYLKALLGIYEKNDVALFRDLFMWAYKRSSQRYSAIQQSFGEPNLLKLKYRSEVHEIIRAIVKSKTPGKKVAKSIKLAVEKMGLSAEDSKKLLEILEIEIASLHEGNIARYQLRPSDYREWAKFF